jgi:hypothetical protein
MFKKQNIFEFSMDFVGYFNISQKVKVDKGWRPIQTTNEKQQKM